MSTLSSVPKLPGKAIVLWPAVVAGGVLVLAAMLVPNLNRKTMKSVPQDKAQENLSVLAHQQFGSVSNRTALAGGPSTNTSRPSASFDRKIVRTGSLQAVVKSPSAAAEQLRVLAEGLGGYIENLQINADQGAPTANLTLRVPAAHLEDAKAAFRKLALHIENEQSNASDVTKSYVDLEARIRNLRAEEAQYLAIMRRATKVDDMLQVSEKISSVRGEIEQQQAEFATLSKQVETVALTIYLRAQPVAPPAAGWPRKMLSTV
jgi:hypothetical protein